MDVGGSAALVAWLRSREQRTAPVELLVGQPVMDNGRGGDEHGPGDGDGEDVTVVHGPVIDHTGASGQETGRMADADAIRARLAELPADNGWARP